MKDIFERIKNTPGPLGQYQGMGDGYFMFPRLVGEVGPEMEFNGKKVLNWSLNNYLGLANHPEVRKTDAEAAAMYGLGAPMGARMMSGNTDLHIKFENDFAEFIGKPAGLVMNFGYQGMISIIDCLAGRNDVIVYDSEAHACILDGMRLSLAKRYAYRHNDMESLEKQLNHACKLADQQGGGVLVITEGVYGMAGDLGHLDEIVKFKEKYPFRILIDDAHGLGTMGAHGRGTAEHYGVTDQIDVIFDAFAKSMGSIGGVVNSEREIIDHLRFNMRSQTYAKSLPLPLVVGNMKRLELIKTHPEYREHLWTIVNALQDGFRKEGFNMGCTESPVTPIYFEGGINEGTNVVVDLRENYGIFCSLVTYPVIPKGQLMLRIIPTACHTLEHVERTIEVFKEVKKKLDAGVYSASPLQNMNVFTRAMNSNVK
ncbi:MAG: pyridoxal phosphate-dependent aminotransferase family protein [Bacteroidaceae bacterium]|nr:pyridoxal phosphate-dependent aminotransferase family protein [Bacteroidaceae bacterium]